MKPIKPTDGSRLSDDELNSLVDGQGTPADLAALAQRLAADPISQTCLTQWQSQRAALRGLHTEVLEEVVPPALLQAAQKSVPCVRLATNGGATVAWQQACSWPSELAGWPTAVGRQPILRTSACPGWYKQNWNVILSARRVWPTASTHPRYATRSKSQRWSRGIWCNGCQNAWETAESA